MVRRRPAERVVQLPGPNIENGLGDKTAIIFEADDGTVTKASYKELHEKVCKFANGLKSKGIAKGDRVIIYMSMSVEGVAAMQRARASAPPTPLSSAASRPNRCRNAIIDAGAVAVITGDEQLRGGKKLH